MPTERPLLEREEQLMALTEAMDSAAAGRGSLVLIAGEAGAGKTALVRRFTAGIEWIPVVTGVCDPLPTAHAMGPLLDMALGLGPSVAQLLAGSSSSRELFAAVLARLTGQADPMVR